MLTLTIFLGILLVVVIVGAAAYVVDEWQRKAEHAQQLGDRLRVEHEQFLAEMRLQRMTHAALQQLLDEGRRQ